MSEIAPEARLIGRFAGIEVMRRLIGVAQLPLEVEPGYRSALLGRSRLAVLEGDATLLWK